MNRDCLLDALKEAEAVAEAAARVRDRLRDLLDGDGPARAHSAARPADIPDLNDGSWLTIKQAAGLARKSPDTIRRRAPDLGRKVLGTWMIDRRKLFADPPDDDGQGAKVEQPE